jgi:diguanylate cyclase (GGDEF)-like protein
MRKSGFFRSLPVITNIRVILAWVVGCLLLVGLLWTVMLSELDREHAATRAQAFSQASLLSKTYADQLTRSVEQFDQITRHLQYYWRVTNGSIDLDREAKAGLYPVSMNLYVSIADSNGWIASTTRDSIGKVNIANTDYFQAHKNRNDDDLLISGPAYAPRFAKMAIRFSRRLETTDGRFGGIVLVAVEPSYFASFPEESNLNKGDFLSVMRTDHSLLALKSGGADNNGASLRPPRVDTAKGVAAFPAESFADKESRIVAWQKLGAYPLMVATGLSESGIFALHEHTARIYRNIAIAGTVALLIMMLTGIVLSLRMAWRREQAEKIESTYRLATDSAREGFYMVRALYETAKDGQKSLVDFLFEDCNERGASYYRMTRHQLIGKRLSQLPFGDYLNEIVRVFTRAMDSGFFEDEFRVPQGSPLDITWVQRRLVRSGDGLAVTMRDISDTKSHEEALSHLANADAVTTLPNRHWLMQCLPMSIARARAAKMGLAVLFVDLDDFKNINDTQGHAAGDELLRAVASRLKAVVRPQDNVVRLGGDEFTIILEQVTGVADVTPVASRIIASLIEPFTTSNAGSHTVHASIGISMFPQDGEDGDTLLKHADIAMYAAKGSGKAHFEFYRPQLSQSLMIKLSREQSLRRAIELDEFVLFYQPRVDAFTGELRSMEALVRWLHPERGIVPPNEFIPMAEETGMIVQLGEMVIHKACEQLQKWQDDHLAVVPVSINVSPRQFNEGNVSQLFANCMSQYGINPSLIEIEITESCMMGEDSTVDRELAEIEALGIKLLVDDFGTGYSSMSHLQRLDFDILKVDRSFTQQLCKGKEGEAFFMAILSMAHVLGMSVVAEGVETADELRVLQELSCNEVQGYFVSRPVPAIDVPALLSKRFLFPGSLQPKLRAI